MILRRFLTIKQSLLN